MASRGAEPLALDKRLSVGTHPFGFRRNRLVAGADDHGKGCAGSLWGRAQHMRQQRLASDGMQNLWHGGPHPRALAGREYDRKAGPAGHPIP